MQHMYSKGAFCPDDTWSNEAQDSEKEEQPQQISDWCEDIENSCDFRARVPIFRRRLGQPINAIILHPSRRRRPTGVLSGLPLTPDFTTRPNLPTKLDHLRTWQCTQSDPEQDQDENE